MSIRTFSLVALALVCALARPALAIHEEDIPILKNLAHQMESAAEHAHHEAEENAHHFSWWEKQLLADMHHFVEDAGKFHRTVESYFSNQHTVKRYLDHANRWARRVDQQIHWAHSFHHVVHDWNRAMMQLRQINRYFYPGGGHGGGHDGHPTPRSEDRRERFDRLHPAR